MTLEEAVAVIESKIQYSQLVVNSRPYGYRTSLDFYTEDRILVGYGKSLPDSLVQLATKLSGGCVVCVKIPCTCPPAA